MVVVAAIIATLIAREHQVSGMNGQCVGLFSGIVEIVFLEDSRCIRVADIDTVVINDEGVGIGSLEIDTGTTCPPIETHLYPRHRFFQESKREVGRDDCHHLARAVVDGLHVGHQRCYPIDTINIRFCPKAFFAG